MSEKAYSFFNSIAAFIISVLSGLGVGSGGLLVAYLVATEQTENDVRAVNLFFFLLSAVAASLMNIRSRKFFPRFIFTVTVFGIIGSLCGVYFSTLFHSDTVKIIFGCMLILSGAYSLISGFMVKRNKKTRQN